MPRSQQNKSVKLDAVQALKRAFLHRGWIFRSQAGSKVMPQPDSKSKPAVGAKSKPAPKRMPQPDEFYDNGQQGEKKPLKKSPQDSKSAKGPENLVELTENSQDVLFSAETVFPFTLFPDTITLDREKLTIANRFFWRTANITSTPVSEVMSCEANVGPFFGSVHLTFRFFTDNVRVVNFLWRKDAIEMQRLVHGYIIAHRREIDCSSIPKDKLVALLVDLGQGVSD